PAQPLIISLWRYSTYPTTTTLVAPILFHASPSPAMTTTQPSTLSLHDALPISSGGEQGGGPRGAAGHHQGTGLPDGRDDPREVRDRKSTRLNSSHVSISYAVFCLKKKKKRGSQMTLTGRPQDDRDTARGRDRQR